MKLVFSDNAWEDYLWWQSPGNEKGLDRVNELLKAAGRMPFKGIGKPEPLKGDLSGWWSRRITAEHRFVYRVSGKGDGQSLEIAQLRYHY
ncbi:Txe/YoeB family addiction module toxin [Phaeobacter sp. JH18-32]|uniref:Txe/YoeB family addiction module toxin n=1 Tax=Phaeobacter TaxID=302485 RepID=UPI0021A859E2|nr:Txe/YoeB family addiction module toxin [Phaeobacter inhibens]UWR87125.1 Txe/YoeB family addiction module toxin [Phaeobacter inhibens]